MPSSKQTKTEVQDKNHYQMRFNSSKAVTAIPTNIHEFLTNDANLQETRRSTMQSSIKLA